jgi:hypothetical protein
MLAGSSADAAQSIVPGIDGMVAFSKDHPPIG